MNTTCRRWLAWIWVMSVSIGVCRADDWPQWLGPQRDSVWRETGIVEQFPAGGPVVKWRVPIAGGYAGPAVADGRVYVTDYATRGDRTPDPNSRSKLQGQERVWCFSAADGRVLWKHEYDCAYEISFPAGPRATPTVDGDRVYTLGAQGDLFCLKTADGSVVWSHNFQRDYQATTPLWGYCGHPLVDGDKLFCVVGGAGSIAVAFDKQTGKELWRALTAKEQAYCPPTMIEAGGKRQLVIWHAEAINGLDPQTGQVYWSVPLDANYAMGIATPRQLGQYLFAGGIVNKSALLQAGRGPAHGRGRVAWGARQGHRPGDGHAVSGGRLPVRRGRQRRAALRRAWRPASSCGPRTRPPRGADRPEHSACAFLVKNGDRFFLASETGDLIIARLTPEKYTEISRAKIIEPTGVAFGRSVWWSHPAFANRCLFARNDQELICLSLAADPAK